MKRKHQRSLELIFGRPTSGNVHWRDIEALFVELGAEVTEREGSRVAVVLAIEAQAQGKSINTLAQEALQEHVAH